MRISYKRALSAVFLVNIASGTKSSASSRAPLATSAKRPERCDNSHRRIDLLEEQPYHHHRDRDEGRCRDARHHDWSRAPATIVSTTRANLSSTVTKITRALLPFAPLIVEAPALATHARRSWPWVRAWLPFAFVSSPRPTTISIAENLGQASRSRQRQRPDVGGRQHVSRTVSSIAMSRDRRLLLRSTSTRHEPIADRHDERRIDSFGESSDSSKDEDSSGHDRNILPPSLSRLAAIRTVLISAIFWIATMRRGFAISTNGASPVAAGGKDSEGNGGEGGVAFGSKAFTEKSYDGFATGYDDLDGGWAASAIGMEGLRSQLLERASGRVLEVGAGTGLNFRHYSRECVSSIDAVDLSPGMLRQASARKDDIGMKDLVRLQQMDVEDLKFPSDTFDTVVDTFSLCVFSDPSAALREMARVCKPTGRVLLLENSKSGFGPLAAYQDLTASYLAERGGAKGCFWNQDVDALARGAGLRVEKSSSALPGGLFRTLECVPIM